MEYMLLHSCFLDLGSSFFMAYSLLLVKHNLNTVIFKLGGHVPLDGQEDFSRNKQPLLVLREFMCSPQLPYAISPKTDLLKKMIWEMVSS